jgi:hypothetical protein
VTVRALLLVAATLAVGAAPALAKSKAELAWPFDQVFQTAVRFVRVDRDCKLIDRDEAAGFLVFECAGDKPGQTRRGTLELVRGEDKGRYSVRVQVQLADEPRWVELRFLELLERKLREERGSPPTPPRPPPTPPRPDGGA